MTTATDFKELAPLPAEAPPVPGDQTPFRRFLSDFAESKVAVAGFFTFLAIVLIAILAPWISPTNPYDLAAVFILDSRLPPGEQMMSGTVAWLGTDDQGRDMLSAVLYG
ncbi:MAG: ABC transporter permease, partial [Geminicoccales bacterium]